MAIVLSGSEEGGGQQVGQNHTPNWKSNGEMHPEGPPTATAKPNVCKGLFAVAFVVDRIKLLMV